LIKHRLKAWPYKSKVGVREHNPYTNQTDIHLFDQWCHLGTVNNEADLEELMQIKSIFAFDLDSYKLLLKTLKNPSIDFINLKTI
jgi:DNA polymerase III subunit epsilon